MITKKRTAVATAIAAAAVGLPLATIAPASADVERKGACSQGNARYDFSVEKDDGRFEVDFEADSNIQGQKWRVQLFHDGKRVFNQVRTTDNDGEVGFDRNRPNTKGKDVFRAKARHLGSGEVCKITITRR